MISLTNDHIQELFDYCQLNSPYEVCGLLAGKDSKVEKLIFISNQYQSPTRFFMEPIELLNALTWVDEQKLDLIGIFHSHPSGPEYPSKTDIKEFYYPGVFSIIIANILGKWVINAFDIKNQTFSLHEIKLISSKHKD